jgi:hypothetical protein
MNPVIHHGRSGEHEVACGKSGYDVYGDFEDYTHDITKVTCKACTHAWLNDGKRPQMTLV